MEKGEGWTVTKSEEHRRPLGTSKELTFEGQLSCTTWQEFTSNLSYPSVTKKKHNKTLSGQTQMLVHLPNCRRSQRWARLKPAATSGSLLQVQGPSTWAILCCFPKHMKQGAGTEVEQPGLKAIWDARQAECSLSNQPKCPKCQAGPAFRNKAYRCMQN